MAQRGRQQRVRRTSATPAHTGHQAGTTTVGRQAGSATAATCEAPRSATAATCEASTTTRAGLA